MYDISPYPSYRGQQLVNPTFSDRRYRNHRQHDDHNNSRRMSDYTHPRRPSMSEILGKTTQQQQQQHQRPHTSNATPSSSSSLSFFNNQQITSISPSERLHDIEIVKNLPDYPQRFNR